MLEEENVYAGKNTKGDLELTLNDAATFLIQLEPNDLSELAQLKEMLDTITDRDSCSESSREDIRKAVQTIEGVIFKYISDTDSAIDKIGKYIGSAINAEEELEDMVEKVIKDPAAIVDPRPSGHGKNHVDSDFFEMPESEFAELIDTFIIEGLELIASAEEALLVLENNLEDMDSLDTVFRAFHSIKGSAALLKFDIINKLAHQAEDLLDRMRCKEIQCTCGYADLALRALDMMKDLMHDIENSLNGEPLLRPKGYHSLMKLLEYPEQSDLTPSHQKKEETGQREESPSPKLGDILVAQDTIKREPLEHIAANMGDKSIGEAVLQSGAVSITDVGQAVRGQWCSSKGRKPKTIQTSIRVSTDRLDRLINMVGELVIAHAMVAEDQIVAGSVDHEFQKKVTQTSKIVRELQNMTMSLRMVPLKTIFNKMSRLVRDVSRKIGKKVNFIIEGEDTDIDRNMADAIKDPLVHMVRNAVDHGIERPDERARCGKPIEGTIKLSAYHSAGSIVVEIEDDGKGLDRKKILAKSIERGLLKEGASPSEREIFNMIFEPGFSTVETITDVSGRGVGMDVVKKNIEAIRGRTEIQSEFGMGSLFQMRLPLTLAIIDGMVIRVGSELYIIPMLAIVTSIKPEPGSISKVFDQGEMLALQGKFIPLFRLADLFQIQGKEEDPEMKLVVVVEDDGKQTALVIDELIGRQQVVIKTLGETMRNIPGIAGGAIMPNGRVGLIVDVGGVVKLANTYGCEELKAVA